MLAFWVKKVVGTLLMPLSLVFVLLTAAWLAPRLGLKHPRWRRRLTLAAVALLYLASCPPVAWLALWPLERDQAGYVAQPDRPVTDVAVLGAGYHPVAGRPLTGVLSGAAVTRVAEAVRVLRLHPEARLHCSGWGGRWEGSNAEAACQLAAQLGVAPARLVTHPDAKDTAEEAAAVARALQATPQATVVVVTHAAHMPRALQAFRGAGLAPMAAPTGHVSPASPRWRLWPSVEALGTTTGALHEWLGRAWLWLRS